MQLSFIRPFGIALLLTFSLLMVACQPVTSLSPLTITPTIQPSAAPSATPTRKLPQLPTATASPAGPGRFVGSFGAGYFSGIFHSPDGKRIFVPGNGKELRWYDATTLKQEGSMILSDYSFGPSEVIFSSDPNLVFVAGFFIGFLIDLKDQQIISTILAGEFFGDVQFSQDAKLLFFRSFESHHDSWIDKVKAWDIQQDKSIHSYWESEFDEQSYVYTSVSNPAISTNGKWIAAGYGKLLQIRDVQTEAMLQSFTGHNSEITNVAFSKAGSRLASIDKDGSIYLWNSQTGQKLGNFSLKLETQALKLSFSENAKQLIVICDDGSQQTLNLQTGQVQGPVMPAIEPLAMTLHQQGYSQFDYSNVALTISPDGKTLAVGSGTVLLWDIQTQKLIGVLENSSNVSLLELQFDPTGRLLAGITYYQTLVWDTTSSAQPNLAKVFGPVVDADWREALSFSADGKYIAVGRSNYVEIWDVITAQKVKTFQMNGKVDTVRDTQFLENDQALYALVEMEPTEDLFTGKTQIQIWNIQTGQMARAMEFSGYAPYQSALRWPLFAFENSGDDQQRWIEIWNLETKTSKKIDGGLMPTFFSKNGDLLFGIDSLNYHFGIWQINTGKQVYTWPQLGDDSVKYSLDLLHASNFVAAYGYRDGVVQLFDISSVLDEARQP